MGSPFALERPTKNIAMENQAVHDRFNTVTTILVTQATECFGVSEMEFIFVPFYFLKS